MPPHAAALSAMRTSGWRSITLARIAGPVRARRHEQPQLPGDDLGDQADRLQPVDHAVGEAGELDAEVAHDPDAAKLQPVLKLQDRPAVEHGRRRRRPG